MNRVVIRLSNTEITSAQLWATLVLIICIPIIIYLLYRILSNPFSYPYYTYEFDVSGKRNVNIEDYIDRFLCDPKNWRSIQQHEQTIRRWKRDSLEFVQNSRLRKYRYKQYQSVLDDENAYYFETVRSQTRYRQRNYRKIPYTVTTSDSGMVANWQWLAERYSQLDEIGFQATLKEYHSNNQRKLMTKALRQQSMERDQYTCQLCGKYMPDEVGLQIDHIYPVAKGGKTVPSNLRVLCSKCNGHKGARIDKPKEHSCYDIDSLLLDDAYFGDFTL